VNGRPPLERVLADFREDAAVLRRRGHASQADTIESVCNAVRDAAIDFVTWISEGEAMMRSGRGADYFRSRRQLWSEDGLAEQRGRTWYYRRCVVERRKLASITRAEARRGKTA
jgi:hypothetical protein